MSVKFSQTHSQTKDEALNLIIAFSVCSLATGIFLSVLLIEACVGAFNRMKMKIFFKNCLNIPHEGRHPRVWSSLKLCLLGFKILQTEQVYREEELWL